MDQLNRQGTNFRQIFRYFLWAIISALLFALITNYYYIRELQKNTQSNYSRQLEQLSGTINTTLDEINRTTALFSLSEELNQVLNINSAAKETDFTVISRSLDGLREYKNTRSFIADAVILWQADNIVIGSNGTAKLDEFFQVHWYSEDYSAFFWQSIQNYVAKYDVFPPTTLVNNISGTETRVVPTKQYATDTQRFRVPVIVTLHTSYFQDLLVHEKLTDNSILYIYDRRGAIVSQSGPTNTLSDDTLMDIGDLSIDQASPIQRLEGTRYLIVRHISPKNHYTYCALVPYSDFIRESFQALIMPVFLLFAALIFVTAIAYYLSRRLYKPIAYILKDNQRLKDDLTMAIPYVCERYLLSIFNDNRIIEEEDVRNFLQSYDISFPKSHFLVIQSVLNFKEDFFETNTRMTYNQICQESLLTASDAFSGQLHSYVFTVSSNRICILLNLKKDMMKADLMAAIQVYHKSIDHHPQAMTVHSGIGRIHEGFTGLQKSYQESLKASTQITYMNKSMIRTYAKSDDLIAYANYRLEDENKLINYLLQGSHQPALELLKDVIDANTSQTIGHHALRELYLQLYNTAVRALTMKEISVYDLMAKEYQDITTNIGDIQPKQLHTYIHTVYEKVLDYMALENTTKDMANLKHYIDNNYDRDLYLDDIAERFGKSPKYMSAFIKKSLGTTFQGYISSMRIQKAKSLLTDTAMSVNDIAKEVGFNSRHPFIRKFKILEGVTPTEFRKLRQS